MRDLTTRVFGSILVRLTFVFGAMVMMTAAAISIGLIVFQSTSDGLGKLSSQSLPDLRRSARIVALTDAVRGQLAEILIAGDLPELNALYAATSGFVDKVRELTRDLNDEEREILSELATSVNAALDRLVAARADEIRSARGIARAIDEASDLKLDASAAIATLSDTAYFDLVVGGEATMGTVDATLTTLVNEHFARLQAMLEIRGEVNLLSGLALSATQTRDTAIRAMLTDLGAAAGARLDSALPMIADAPATSSVAEIVEAARGVFENSIHGEASSPATILSKRQEVDVALSTALDDIVFETTIESEDAKEANSKAITSLLDEQVNNIRAQSALNAAAKTLFASLLEAAIVRDRTELVARAEAAAVDASRLKALMSEDQEALNETLRAMLAFADPEGGIVTLRRSGLDARDEAAVAAREAADIVGAIALKVATMSDLARAQIDATAAELGARVATARGNFEMIAIASILLAALALLSVWWMVIRPLNRVTCTTERLAAGKLDPIEGLSRSGEIGRMARALKVFRTGAMEQIRLQAGKEKTEAAARTAERAAEKQRQAALERERAQAAEREQAERRREQLELDRREKERTEAEAERQARALEQDTVVNELASGLQKLASGDLTYRIDTEFTADYDALRRNYNEAMSTLASLVGQIADSATTIDSSTSEIASASADLARRTEGDATSLQETALALNELTESVTSAAKASTTADATVRQTRGDAESSRSVMREAITAMKEIEEFSKKITTITDVIDDISFQTNLLALNAGVEAARAGDAGRGFAVVASEVRALARRSSDAARQISQLITGSTAKIDQGASRVDQAGTALESVILAISDISHHVAQIAKSAGEQSRGIADINAAMHQLDDSTQRSVAIFEEATGASQALRHEASSLAEIVSRFQTETAMQKETVAQQSASRAA